MLTAASVGCRSPEPPPPRPDVVVFVVDTLRADHLPLYGHERATAPWLTALARESVVYDRAFAHSSWTLASTATLLTGRFPSEHRAVRDPDDPLRFGRLAETVPTLAGRFQEAGYRTGAFVNNVYLAPEFGLGRGFERYDYDAGPGGEERTALETIDRMLTWVAESDEPYFAYVHLMEPHLPYLPPKHLRRRFTGPGDPPVPTPFADNELLGKLMNRIWVPEPHQQQYIRRMYDEEILAADEALGRLVKGLRGADRWEHTFLAFSADHGEEFWDHGGFEHGTTLFGELLRVPLVIRGLDLEPPPEPGEPAADGEPAPEDGGLEGLGGTRVATPVQHVDLFRTALEVAGIDVPEGTHGEDLRRVHRDPRFASQARPILSEDCLYGPPRAAVTLGNRRFILNLQNHHAALYALDEYGQNDRYLGNEDGIEEEARPLYRMLVGLRGGAQAVEGLELTATIDETNMEKLRALGYVE